MALALAAGDVAGLALARADGAVPPGAVAVGIGLLCVLAGRAGVRSAAGDRRGRGVPLAVTLALAVLVGVLAGLPRGTAALGACVAKLEGNAPAVAAGTVADAVPAREAGPGAGLVRVSIRDARIVSGGAVCRLGALRAFVRPGAAHEAGSAVLARGVWRTADPGRLPRPPEALGWLSGASLETLPAEHGLRGPRGLGRWIIGWRAALLARLDARLAPRHRAIGKALLLADRSTLDPATRDAFVGAGIIHLLAISGLHVGLIGASLAWLIGLRVQGPRRLLWAAALTSGYVVLIGAPPSAVRAALMFWGWALAFRRARPARIGDLAALAATLAILADPLIVTDPGFQLSFAGFTGVVVGGRVRLPRPLSGRRVKALARALAVSCGAFLATAPIAAFHFERIVIASIPASVVAGAVVGLALPALALTLVLPWGLWVLFAGAADAALACLAAIASFFADLPLSWSGPGLGPRTWLAAAGLAALALDRTRVRRGLGIVAVGAGLALASAWPSVRSLLDRGTALVCTLDVGQGDAAVVRTGAGRWLVFDAGPGGAFAAAGTASGRPAMSDAGGRVVVPFLHSMGARTVELFAISHPHLDHFGGAAAVFAELRVRRVFDPGVPEPSAAYLAFLERVEEEGASWHAPRAGDRLRIDDVELEILWPEEEAGTDANEGSLSFRLTVHGFRYVNTGDASEPVERSILARLAPDRPEADLLKLGHHGSRTSTSLEWLRATGPDIALISAGRGNRYGHPHAVTLARLDSARVARVWRTDVDGPLCVESDADGWRIVDPP
ncbi:DNA internalization-related competence protein ComEC/Rec2 [Candidatus Palauibacter sp.]|uniref:DNA internalization-related competence protein ComEC/Rec2 n=1 Tax=Candidatus Palauibacter sp. TaxID=3101350 RepID=UPI003B0163C3